MNHRNGTQNDPVISTGHPCPTPFRQDWSILGIIPETTWSSANCVSLSSPGVPGSLPSFQPGSVGKAQAFDIGGPMGGGRHGTDEGSLAPRMKHAQLFGQQGDARREGHARTILVVTPDGVSHVRQLDSDLVLSAGE